MGLVLVLLTILRLGNSVAWSQSAPASLSGTVVDAASGETLPGANVWLRPCQCGMATDLHGRFLIEKLAPGRYELIVSFIGFETYRDSVLLASGPVRHLHLGLKPQPVAIPEVTVSAERDRFTRKVNLGQEIIGGTELRRMSSLAEPDLFRSLALLPGVIQSNDINSRFYVRGGQGNENHILVDGVTIHNPYHALGFFSTFDVDAIKAVEFYRGVFPARYSERLSSVTNVILRDGNAQRFTGSAMLSMATSKLLLEGPLSKYDPQRGRKWTYMLSGRSTYLDKVIPDFPLYFYDFSVKSVYERDPRTRLMLHGFYGFDKVRGVSDVYADIKWENRVIGLEWLQFFSPKSVLTSHLSYSDFHSDANNVQKGPSFDTIPGLSGPAPNANKESLRQENSFREISFSTEWKSYWFNALNLTGGYGFSRFNIDQHLSSFFRQVFKGRWRENDQHKVYLSLEGGWRGHWIYDCGITWLYFPTGFRQALAPRLGFKYLLGEAWRLKAGAGRHFQFLTTINDDDDVVVLFDAWVPSPTNRPIASADHYGLGVEFGRSSTLEAELEFYYRHYDGLTRYNRSQREDEPFYLDGWAESYGMEVRANYRLKSYYGFVNYTLGRAISHFFIRNQPMRFANDFRWQSFPAAGDVRHTFNSVLGIRPRGKWDFSISLIYQSGRPYTAALGSVSREFEIPAGAWPPFDRPVLTEFSGSELVYSGKNALRFPFYQRVDFRAAHNFEWLNMDCSFFAQVYNVLFRKNTSFQFPDLGRNQKDRAFGLPILPTVGISFRF